MDLRIAFLAYLFTSVASQRPEETKNVCHYELLPPPILSILEKASIKLLQSPDAKDYSHEFNEVQSRLDELSEAFVITDEELGTTEHFGQTLTNQQKITGQQLNSVLNSTKDISGMINQSLSITSQLSETVTDLVMAFDESNNILANLTTVIGVIAPLSQKSTFEEELPQADSIVVGNAEDIAQLINQTHSMVKRLLQSSEREESLKMANAVLQRNLKEAESLVRKFKKKLDHSRGLNRPSDCNDLYMAGIRKNGVYNIYPYSCECSSPVKVYCDMKDAEGGWTVILKRMKQNVPENFTRPWQDYKIGFGETGQEYWLGNDIIHTMTSAKNYALQIDMQSRGKGRKKWGLWKKFQVGSQLTNYELTTAEFSASSTIGRDVLKKHNYEMFSTYDRDNDASLSINCANKYKGGWWYGRCFDIHPTGVLGADDKREALATSWFHHGKKSLVPLKKLVMKIKPTVCVGMKSLPANRRRGCKNEIF